MDSILEVRCQHRRRHTELVGGIATQVDVCNHLLGGVAGDSYGVFWCGSCKCFWIVVKVNDSLMFSCHTKDEGRLKLEKATKVII
jgi:hypothetical protein